MRAVVATNIATGEEHTFYSASEAARVLQIDINGILACCNGKQKKTRGYRFRDAGDQERSITLLQAEVIMALANNGLVAGRAGDALYRSRTSIYHNIDEIQKTTGKNPLDFWDMIELVELAKQVIALEERCRKEKERRA